MKTNVKLGYWIGLLVLLVGLVGGIITPRPVQAAATISVQIIAAPNLVVDSNVLSPSTYSPKVATVIGKICNTGDAPASNVTAYIGDYTGSGAQKGTPGVYPSKTNVTIGGQYYKGTYAFKHLGPTSDAARFLGDLAPGECRYQFWSFEYPLTAKNASDATIPAWGTSVKPDDDLSLDFDIWAMDGAGALVDYKTHTMTMRNEISAMANKIKPNGNPGGQWFNTDTSTVYPGETITTNGILYRLGNINQGFDNDGDGVPDYNAWLQPFGDPAYDPACFRLVGVTGVLTVTRSGGRPDLIIPINNNLYFTNIPPDNTDVVGEVYYEFMALGGACTIPISPYQEVASGKDNEKFNGDYGTGVPALLTYEPEIVVEKNGDPVVAEAATITYNIPFRNESTQASAGLTLSSGGAYSPFTIEDTVPTGLQYVGGSAAVTLNYTPVALPGYLIYYSTDSGVTWSTTDPGDVTSTAPNSLVKLRWVLTDPLPKKPTGGTAPGGTATFQAKVPSGYITGGGTPFVENCAQAQLGDATPMAQGCTTTMVQGTGVIGDRVWADVNGDGNQTGESSIANITVNLYWDKNDNGALDAGDVLVKTATTTSATANYSFTQLPAGKYIVKVDAADADLPAGYAPTTVEFYAITLTAGQTVDTADFGFGPTLRVDKRIVTPGTPVVGETITYTVDLINTRPGDGSPNGYCVYDLWAGNATTLDSPKDFVNPANAIGMPNLTYAMGDFSTGSNKELTGSSYSSGGRTSGISKVEVLINAYFDKKLANDTLLVTVGGWSKTFTTAELNVLAPTEAQKGYLKAEIPAASAPGGSWDWGDFAGLSLNVAAQKDGGGDPGNILVDALGFRVTTTDPSCATGDSTIQFLPFTDTFDATKLQFVSADPLPTSVGSGSLTWANLGPLYAGGTRTLTLVFKALATATGTVNTASVTGAKFASGRDVNNASDTATVDIATSGSISGHVFADNHNPGAWQSGTGYSSGDTFIPGVEVQLWACMKDGLVLDSAGAPNKPCTDSANGGAWVKIATQRTASDGSYTFGGLRMGYYNVIVNTATLPPNFTTNSVETSATGNGTGSGGGDSQWNSPTANLNTFNPIDTSGENISAVSFGYKDGGTTTNQGAVVGYVWHDVDGDGSWITATEQPIANVTVRLCSDADCATVVQTVTTDAYGRYAFGDVAPGSYYVQVTQPNGMTQSGDPDSTLDNKTTSPITVVANGVTNAGNFGYTGGYTIGDTLYVDWDGDGAQDAGEPGLSNITVYLYRDANGNGVIDNGDPLIGTQVTNSSGVYQFTGLPGNGADYIVKVNTATLPAGYTLTADPVGAMDNLAPVELTNANNLTIDFGYQPRGFGRIGDTIWADANGNGVQDSGEPGVSGVLVKLYVWNDDGDDVYEDGELGAYVAQAMTDSSGQYLFNDLPAGKFVVKVDDSNFVGGQPLAGLTASGDPDSVKDGLHALTLGPSQSYLTADFGFTSSSIGDFIWQDNNGDGLWQSNEPGIPNVVVELYLDANNDGVPDGAALATTTTDSSGKYLFGGLSANNYIVKVADSNFGSGGPLYQYTLTGDPDAYKDNVPGIFPCTDADMQECDSMKKLKGVTVGTVFFPGLPLGQNDMSSDFGYQPATRVIGDTLWIDTDGDATPDATEPRLADITVKLCADASCSSVLQTTTTNEEGFYTFAGLSDGTYYVAVDGSDSDLPAGLSATYDLDGVDSLNVAQVVLSGSNRFDADFGYRFVGSNTIAGTVWHDDDSGGQSGGIGDIDSSETIRYADVPVYLWRCVSGCGGSDDILIGTIFTNSSGQYSFDNLADGDYRVIADKNAYSVQGLTTTTPTSYSGVSVSGGSTAQRDFGFVSAMDFGDLPAAYAGINLVANNGARHIVPSSGAVYLGSAPNTEGEAKVSDNAAGDTDEGVVVVGKWGNGFNGGTVGVTVEGCSGTCYISAWIDWNSDGDFNDAGEAILIDRAVANGSQNISFNVPAGTFGSTAKTFNTRFRLYPTSTNGTARPSGLVYNGEVEDYQWSFAPTAVQLSAFEARHGWPIVGVGLVVLSAGLLLVRRRRR